MKCDNARGCHDWELYGVQRDIIQSNLEELHKIVYAINISGMRTREYINQILCNRPKPFWFCPWCGTEIDWEWDRLKSVAVASEEPG